MIRWRGYSLALAALALAHPAATLAQQDGAQAPDRTAAASQALLEARRAREAPPMRETAALTGAALVRALTQLSDAGNITARWQLAVMLDTGDRGVTPDPARGFRLASSAAEAGELRALVSRAVMHATGRGTPVDYAASMRDYRAAASGGEPHGFYGVGVLYHLGQGVPADSVKAAAWMAAGAVQGNGSAQAGLRRIFPTLSAAQQADAIAQGNMILRDHGLEQRLQGGRP